MKKVLYIHGAFSAFKPKSEKVLALKKSFNVFGASYSMETPFNQNLEDFQNFCILQNIEVIIGTSLGGLYASWISKRLGLPCVLINPCVDPAGTIHRLIGEHTNYTTGKLEKFTQSLADSFPSENHINDHSLVCVGLKDDVINPLKTIDIAKLAGAEIIINENEDHYWEFFDENKAIQLFIQDKL
jgi:predicted esterase YcpF (UPF0227 family)